MNAKKILALLLGAMMLLSKHWNVLRILIV